MSARVSRDCGPLLILRPPAEQLQRQSSITRSSYSSSTSRSSRRLRRWWGSRPSCGALGRRWRLLPGKPGSVSYASPRTLTHRLPERRDTSSASSSLLVSVSPLLTSTSPSLLHHCRHHHHDNHHSNLQPLSFSNSPPPHLA